jgi:hypothetical protein
MSNAIPGFQAAQDVLNIYLNSLRNQGEVWNAAFGSMLGGSYEYKDWMRDIAKTFQLQQDAASAVASYRPGGTLADEAPVWLHFYIEASKAKLGDFTISGKTRTFVGPNLDTTWILSEGPPSLVPFKIEADSINRSSIVVKLSPTQGPSTEGALRALAHEYANHNYLGMIWDGKEFREPPLAIVSLAIRA